MKTLSQIAIDFAANSAARPGETAGPQNALPPKEGLPPDNTGQGEQDPGGPNAGFRLKSLKDTKGGSINFLPVERTVGEISFEEMNEGSTSDEAASGIADKAETPNEPEAMAEELPSGKAVKSTRGRKSLKQTAAEADLIEIPADEELFRKQYYTMGEVAGMFRVNQSLLRFWEAEFDILKPRKNKKGDRYFRPADVKNLHLIYHLLRQRKYTIEGAREFLKNSKKAEVRFETIQRLEEIRDFLLELKAQL